MNTPDMHAKKIALQTLRMDATMAWVNGQTHLQAIDQIARLSGHGRVLCNVGAVTHQLQDGTAQFFCTQAYDVEQKFPQYAHCEVVMSPTGHCTLFKDDSIRVEE